VPRRVIIHFMADRETGKEAPRTGRERLRKLTQAALTADETVDQVQEILADMGQTMASMDTTLGSFDYSLGRVTQAMDRVDGMADQLESLMARLEGVVSRVEKLVGIAETALAPVNAVESVGRNVAGMLGLRRD